MLRSGQRVYIDTSVWCAYSFNEAEAPGAQLWLAQSSLDQAAASIWTRTEFASAAAMKLRAKGIGKSSGQSKAAVAQAARAFEAAFAMTHCLDVIYDDFIHAAELCRTDDFGLRAGDALHIAVALRHDCKMLASLDKAMNASAQQLGLKLVKF